MEPSETPTSPGAAAASAPSETLEQMQARHRREQRDLQGRVTSKKKNATKKTRKGVNDECAELERRLRERQEEELRRLGGEEEEEAAAPGGDGEENKEEVVEQVQEQIAAGVDGLSLGDTTAAQTQQASPTTTAGAAAGGGGGKKRNRQKERLARRAAEQEAAAAKAEEEAAGMVDHRGRESAYMRREMAAHGLVEKDIRPDGHCLFSAVADQLGDDDVASGQGGQGRQQGGEPPEPPYRAVRRAAAGYMLEHADDFAPFLEEPLGAYAARIRDTAEWGGQLELAALASRYGVEIRVMQDGRTEVIEPAAGAGGAGGGDQGERKTVWLAYYRHGYGLGEHYNSLRKAPPA